MHGKAIPVVALIATTFFLIGCNNRTKSISNSVAVDSLKNILEKFKGTEYVGVETYAKKGMKIATDSSDYYYFMSFYASSMMWTNDLKAKDSLQRLIMNYVSRVKPTKKTNDILARYYLLNGNFAVLNHKEKTAVSSYKKAIAYQINGSRKNNVAIMLTNLSDGYLEYSDYANGAACLRRALFLADSLNLRDAKIQAINGLAMIYLGLRNYKESDKYFRLGEKLLPMMCNRQKFFFYNSRGNYYYYKGDYANSLRIFRMMNQQRDSIVSTEYDKNLLWINLADTYIKNGFIDSALIYQKKCRNFFRKHNNQTALYYLETQDIAILLKQNRLKRVNLILSQNRYHTTESDLLLIRDRYLLDYYTRVGDDHKALIYLKRLTNLNDSVRNEIQKMATTETAFRYQQDSKALKLELNLSKSEERLRTSELFLVIAISVIIVLTTLFLSAVAYNRNKRAKMIKEAKKRVLKLRMEELRNRVSPHFVFNVLNYELYNRQHGIFTTDISILVKLIRNGLEVSDELCVPISKELDFVDGYVELQRKGLGDDFHYEMVIDDDVDIDNVMIPSMMIQIAVENAIKHGLRGLEGEKTLEITIKRIDFATEIVVENNGRELELEKKCNENGTGTGTKVINETLEMLNSRNNRRMSYEMKKNPHGNGCRVEIIIPDGYNYSLG
jgi:hypothetical protein